MSFDEFLHSKKIDAAIFNQQEPDRFHEWKVIFDACGAVSFTQQKLFIINETRRKYKLTPPVTVVSEELTTTSKQPATKPAFKPKFK